MKNKDDIGAVRKAHLFNEKVLAEYLGDHLEGFGRELSVRQFRLGQSNPTFLLSSGDKKFVLRKQPPGKLLPSAHAVDREYRILKALWETDVPVPKTYLLCEDVSVIGKTFFVMEYKEGRIFRDPTAPEAANITERVAIFDAMTKILAEIHVQDWKALGLSDYGKPGNYMHRQVHRWTKQYRSAQTDDIESVDNLIPWLQENIPENDETTIAHGDYRLENIIFDAEEPRVIAVLDWELSTLGHPLADLAYNCMLYHINMPGGRSYGYTGRDIKALGIPSEEEYLAGYLRHTGRDEISDWDFFMAFSMFRFTSIIQGVYKRGLDGIASSDDAKTLGSQVRYLADIAWDIASRKIK